MKNVVKKQKSLILLDDCLYDIQKKNQLLNTLITRGRHSGISIWISAQTYKKVPKTIRVNASDIIIFGNQSKLEIKNLYDEFGEESLNEFYDFYSRETNEPYSFLQIRTRFNANKKFTKNFNQQVNIK